MPYIVPTADQEQRLRRVADSPAFVHAVAAAVRSYVEMRDREREATPKAKRRGQLEHVELRLRAARQSLQRLAPEARSALHVADQAEGGDGDVAGRLERMLAAVRRAGGMDRPKRGEQRNASARALRFWLACALTESGLPAEPGDGGPLDFTAQVAVEMIGDDAPDLRTILHNE